jgi:hypothetical protein
MINWSMGKYCYSDMSMEEIGILARSKYGLIESLKDMSEMDYFEYESTINSVKEWEREFSNE